MGKTTKMNILHTINTEGSQMSVTDVVKHMIKRHFILELQPVEC